MVVSQIYLYVTHIFDYLDAAKFISMVIIEVSQQSLNSISI